MPALCILLVEDDTATNDAFSRFLGKRHRVVAAKSAEAALALLSSAPFDLVISDIGLPGATGWELLPQIRAAHPGIKAIALTGYGYPKDLERSAAAGFDLHLTKPVAADQLKGAIEKFFPNRALA